MLAGNGLFSSPAIMFSAAKIPMCVLASVHIVRQIGTFTDLSSNRYNQSDSLERVLTSEISISRALVSLAPYKKMQWD
uniref:Uncharacterized protein n=1 Tax=Romanomermis culicivorax TaxID=13658 RepID=A0A915L7R7_ROMCU